MAPKIAQPGSFHHKRHEAYAQGRLRTNIITIEEAIWLVIGLTFGWLAGEGAKALLILIPLILFVVWVYEQAYASKYGLRFINNAPAGKRK